MRKYLIRLKNKVMGWIFSSICLNAWRKQSFSHFNERAVEYRFVFEWISRIMPEKVLDVGTGETALPALVRTCGCVVTAIDNIKDYWTHGLVNRHWYVIDDDIRCTRITDCFDLVICVSVLEHIKEHDSAVKSMFSRLKKGGYLLLTFPYNELKYLPDVYALSDSNAYGKKIQFTTQVFSRKQIDEWISVNDAEVVAQEYWRFFSGEFWSTGARLDRPALTGKDDTHQITCLIIKKK